MNNLRSPDLLGQLIATGEHQMRKAAVTVRGSKLGFSLPNESLNETRYSLTGSSPSYGT